jgi:hypothetical protein
MMNSKGRPVQGIAGTATAAKFHSVAKSKGPAARIVKVPQAIITPSPFDDNPTLKGYIGATYPSPQSDLPVRAFGRRMVTRGPVGGEDAKGMSQS